MTCRQAYDELIAHLVDNTATAAQDEKVLEGDWVGTSPRAGMAANNDSKLFLQHHESIRILWQVKFVLMSWSCFAVHALVTLCEAV
jgi:hypothetical protein